MNKKLEPCPFCGGEAELNIRPLYNHLKPYSPETADKKYWVQCKKCATQCGANDYETEKQAIAAWNTRPEARQLSVEELEQMDGEPVWVVDYEDSEITGWYWVKTYKGKTIPSLQPCGKNNRGCIDLEYKYGKNVLLAFTGKPREEIK